MTKSSFRINIFIYNDNKWALKFFFLNNIEIWPDLNLNEMVLSIWN